MSIQKGLDGGFGSGEVPSGFERVAFAQLIDRVFLLARSFNFQVPPYFISNVRALGELASDRALDVSLACVLALQ